MTRYKLNSRFALALFAVARVKWPATFALCLALLVAQSGGHAQDQLALGEFKSFKNYILAGGGHAVGGIGLAGQGVNGFATGRIHISGVPDTADISAAFVYWITMETSLAPSSENGRFRGNDIVGKQIAPPDVPACRGSGGGAGTTSGATTLRVYRADVLRFLPLSSTSGRVLVNDSDLGDLGHEISLPDAGAGGSQSPSSPNQATRTEGASLLIVYRDPTKPVNAVVIYDGGQTADQDHPVWAQEVQGFYQAAQTQAPLVPSARITYIVGDGDPSKDERLIVDGAQAPLSNPFQSTLGSAWDNPTVSLTMLGNESSVTTRVEPVGPAVDCLSFAAVALTVPVVDTDADGIPNVVESATSTSPLYAPNGQRLPPLGDMGANPSVPDVFFEINYLKAPIGTPYGSVHSHLPTRTALEMVGKLYMNGGVRPHFDVGPNYQPPSPPAAASCASPATWTLACAIVPVASAEGGQFTDETACGVGGTTNCQFPDWPGTVGWKSGYQYFRDELFGFAGRNRMNIFHHVLFAHALGLPRNPCLRADGTPDTNCQLTNPDFHRPRTTSGMADVGGGDVLITAGSFGNNFVGPDNVQAGTLAHESGHNLELRHYGTLSRPNCVPIYQSVMNYVYQFGFPGTSDLDFSGQVLTPALPLGASDLNENNLSDSALNITPKFPLRWYAPKATSFIHNNSALDTSPATKHCDGSIKNSQDPDMVRIDARRATDKIDWLNDGDASDTGLRLDVNFNGGPAPLPPAPVGAATDGPFNGFDDWAIVRSYGLRQVGSRPNQGGLSLDVEIEDLGRGDPGRGDPGRGDPGRGDPGRGDPGRGDPGRGDPGRGDPGRGDPGAEPQPDQDFESAVAAFGGPSSLTGESVEKVITLTWSAPSLVPESRVVAKYFVYRVAGAEVTPASFAQRVLVGMPTVTTISDSGVTNNKTYTYWVQAEFDNGERTVISNFFTITKRP